MCAELANLNDCAVPFLSRAAVNLSWNDIIIIENNISNFSDFVLPTHSQIPTWTSDMKPYRRSIFTKQRY